MHASVVDLFCGAGGLTHGFIKEGFNVVAGIDIDPTCQHAYEKNNGAKFILADVEQMMAEQVTMLFPSTDLRILVGCAPCQPFSKYSNRKIHDDRWKLLHSFGDLIRDVQPTIVSMENVPQLQRHSVFVDFVDRLERLHYSVTWSFAECASYGVPQTRTRLVLFASKLGPIELVKKTHYGKRRRTVRQAVGALGPIEAGQASKTDPLHRSSGLSALNLTRIACTPAGGGWKDWSEDLLLECHKRKSGKTYRSVYGRMEWDEPGPTVTTQCHGLGNGRFGHPEQDRAISLREAALLQTFPRKYQFVKPGLQFTISDVARHIGNAVPVRLGVIIARSIQRHLEENDGSCFAVRTDN